MIHSMKLNKEPYEAVSAGTKTIEMRLNDEKRKKINVGDIIEFTNVVNSKKVKVEVVALHKEKSFEELYKKFNKISLGYAEHEIALYTDMEQYYLKAEIEKYGVVGIEIKLI